VTFTLLDAAAGEALTPIDCGRVLRPAAGIGGGIAYVFGSIGDAVLFDQDALLVCDDGRPDYELAEGRCGTPGQPFTISLLLTLRVPPYDVCVRPRLDPSATFDLRLEAIEPDRLELSGEVEQAIVDRAWAGRRPDPIPLDFTGAGADGPLMLAVTASDGDTPPVAARAAFRRDGEAALVFGAPPILPALPDRSVDCAGPGGTPVDLDAAATDPDGDPLSFFWLEEDGAGARLLAEGAAPRVLLAPGVHRMVLDVVDATGLLARRAFAVTIADTRPPDIVRLEADPEVLWPPDHRLAPVRIAIEAHDACWGAADARVKEVISSEPDDAPGGRDGHTTGDISVRPTGAGEWELRLRAERFAGGPGRVYRARLVVADASGNEREATVEVTVPPSAPR
jgi:hypothetical protein